MMIIIIIAIINVIIIVIELFLMQAYNQLHSMETSTEIETLALRGDSFSPFISDSLIQERKKFAQVELVNIEQAHGTSSLHSDCTFQDAQPGSPLFIGASIGFPAEPFDTQVMVCYRTRPYSYSDDSSLNVSCVN